MYDNFASKLNETMWEDLDRIPTDSRNTAKITNVSTVAIDGNFPWMLIKIETDQGVTGIGESYPSPGVREIVTDFLGPILIGQPPTDITRLYHLMRELLSGRGGQAGIATIAISGVEIALWDVTGKLLDQPVYQLLGGKVRDSVKVYADCHAGEDMVTATKSADGEHYRPEAYAASAREAIEDGFDLIKFDLDVQAAPKTNPLTARMDSREIEHKRKIVEALHKEVQGKAEFGVDLHWNFTVATAQELCRQLSSYDLAWIEDPIPPENVDVLRELNRATDVSLLTGENRYGRHGFRDLIESQAVSYLAPDVPKTGGIAETKVIANMAQAYYISLVAHNIGSPVATMATAHLGANIPNFVALEYHAREVPWWNDLVMEEPLIEDGHIAVPDEPGLGIEMDWGVVEDHQFEN